MRKGKIIAVVIPALNEAEAIQKVVRDIPLWVDQIVVADNGSTDATAQKARAAGAQVVHVPQRGYGAACLGALAALQPADIVVFLDADYSDDPTGMGLLVDPILVGTADLVIGSRPLGGAGYKVLTAPQILGNALACFLIRLLWGQRYTDLGPFRAIAAQTLADLGMTDRGFGWTVEMQIKAARSRVVVAEVPVPYRRRIGQSKISGTFIGSLRAGAAILSLIARHGLTRE